MVPPTSIVAIDDKNDDNEMPLEYLTYDHRDYIASHLDQDPYWKFVAGDLGLTVREIDWIANRKTAKGSPTLLLLEDLEKKNVSLNKFMEVGNARNFRAVTDYMETHLNEIKEKYQHDKAVALNNNSMNPVQIDVSDFPNKCERKIHALIVHDPQDSGVTLSVARCLRDNDIGVVMKNRAQTKSVLVEDRKELKETSRLANFILFVVSPNLLKNIEAERNWSCKVDKLIGKLSKKNCKCQDRLLQVLVDGLSETDVTDRMKTIKAFKWTRDYKNLIHTITKERRQSGANQSCFRKCRFWNRPVKKQFVSSFSSAYGYFQTESNRFSRCDCRSLGRNTC